MGPHGDHQDAQGGSGPGYNSPLVSDHWVEEGPAHQEPHKGDSR